MQHRHAPSLRAPAAGFAPGYRTVTPHVAAETDDLPARVGAEDTEPLDELEPADSQEDFLVNEEAEEDAEVQARRRSVAFGGPGEDDWPIDHQDGAAADAGAEDGARRGWPAPSAEARAEYGGEAGAEPLSAPLPTTYDPFAVLMPTTGSEREEESSDAPMSTDHDALGAGEVLAEVLRTKGKGERILAVRGVPYSTQLKIMKYYFKGESRRGRAPAIRARLTALVEDTLERADSPEQVEELIAHILASAITPATRRRRAAGVAAAAAAVEDAITEEEDDDEADGEGSGIRAARQARWRVDEYARLICCICDERMAAELGRIVDGETRETLDAPWRSAWQAIAELFNSGEGFDHPAADDDMANTLDPNEFACERSAVTLKKKWGSIKTEYTIVFARWDVSGRGEAGADADLSDFCNASTKHAAVLVFLHAAIGGDPDKIAFSTRLVDAPASFESGTSRRVSDASAGGSPRARKRLRPGALQMATLDELASVLGETSSDRQIAAAATQRAEAATQAVKVATLSTLLAHRPSLTAREEQRLARVLPGLIDALAPDGAACDDESDATG